MPIDVKKFKENVNIGDIVNIFVYEPRILFKSPRKTDYIGYVRGMSDGKVTLMMENPGSTLHLGYDKEISYKEVIDYVILKKCESLETRVC